jgi:hypothetical protein
VFKLLIVMAAVALSEIGCDVGAVQSVPVQVPVVLILGAVLIAGRLAVSLHIRRLAHRRPPAAEAAPALFTEPAMEAE